VLKFGRLEGGLPLLALGEDSVAGVVAVAVAVAAVAAMAAVATVAVAGVAVALLGRVVRGRVAVVVGRTVRLSRCRVGAMARVGVVGAMAV